MAKEFKARIVSLDEAYDQAYSVAQKIMESQLSFDHVVAISRGGLPPARFICDFMDYKDLSTIQVRHYSEGAEKGEEARILHEPKVDFKGKKILLVDDVNDSGESLKVAYDHIAQQNPDRITTAVLHEKNTTDFAADIKGMHMKEWKWLIYQWAVTEDVLEFIKKGDKLGESRMVIRKYLLDEYGLEIEEGLLKKILSLKENYNGSGSE